MKHFDFLLHLKSWEIFLIILIGGLFREIKIEDQRILSAILSAIGMICMGGWPVIIGHRLHHYFPGLNSINYTLFTIASVVWLLSAIVLPFISAFTHLSYIEILTIPGSIFVFLMVMICIFFTTTMIESIEAKKEVGIVDSFGSLFLMFLLPIGIFFFQPMIRKAMQSRLPEASIQPQ
jgi:hypothetical protein